MSRLYAMSARTLSGDKFSFTQLRGKVVLIVNTASACGFTPQYADLEQLHKQYGPQGLVVLGFPCDQFGHQEPGDSEEIASFCSVNYGVTFQLFEKIQVNGAQAHELFVHLKKELPGLLGGQIKWNFTKFLLDRNGNPVKRYAPLTNPLKIEQDIIKLL